MGVKPGAQMKSVIYSLSPSHLDTMSGLWRDMGHEIRHKLHQHGYGTFLLLFPVIATYMWAQSYVEKEKLRHRY